MNKKFIAVLLAVLTAGTTLPAYAQQVEIKESTTENANQTYTLRVYNIGKAVGSDNTADIIYTAEAKSDNNLDVTFNFDFNEGSGYYEYIVKSKSGKWEKKDVLAFVNEDEFELAMKELAEALKASDAASAVKVVFNKYSGVFQLDNGFSIASDIEKLDTKKAYENIVKKINAESTIDEIQDVYKTEMLLVALGKGSDDLIVKVDEGYAEYLGSDNADINELYNKMNNDAKKNVAKAEKGTYGTPKEYVDAHNQAVSLEAINSASSWMELKDVIEKVNKIAGISIPSSNTVYTKLYSKKPFANKADYESKLKTATDEVNNQGGGGSGSGSGNGTKITGGGNGGFNGGTISNNIDTPSSNEKFTDIANVPWAKEAIEYLADKGIVSGKANKIFAPNDNITREEFVKIIVGAFDLKSDDGQVFDDVDTTSWYAPYVKIATGTGVVKGLDANYFGVGKKITRQDAAVMIVRAMNDENSTKYGEATGAFGDASQIADYAKDAVGFLANEGAISGNDEKMFLPNNAITRAEAVKIIYNVIK